MEAMILFGSFYQARNASPGFITYRSVLQLQRGETGISSQQRTGSSTDFLGGNGIGYSAVNFRRAAQCFGKPCLCNLILILNFKAE
jgi:hypothetical protein